MRVAIVGCGQIAKVHVSALQETPGVELCGLCDRDRQRLRELADLVPSVLGYSDLGEMLEHERPDAVHVLTPPQTHAAIAVQAMDAGCHVLVEKPMALSVAEADRMIEAARRNGVELTTNHNYLFSPSVVAARRLVDEGAIGDVVSVVNYYGVTPEESSLATGAGSHWAWRLPGGVFTNFLPHLIYLQEAFLGEITEVPGAVVSGDPQGDGPPSELWALTRGSRASGTLTVSGRAAPYMKYVEVQGTRGTVRADLVRELCVLQRSRSVPGMVAKVLFGLETSAQLATGTVKSTANVLSGRWKRYMGLRVLVREFYASLAAGQRPPVTGEDGRAMVAVLEKLWTQAPQLSSPPSKTTSPATQPRTPTERRLVTAGKLPSRALVTGATGFVGQHLVAALDRCGVEVVAYVRDRARVPFAVEQQAETVVGDLDDTGALHDAMAGVGVVYHCAAVTRNSLPWTVHHDTNIAGTESVLKAAAGQQSPPQVIHLSSVIVYGLEAAGRVQPLSEAASYPDQSERWAYYERSKIEAERLVFQFAKDAGLPVTVVRPGILFGPGRPLKSGLVRLGSARVSIGRGRNRLPLTYVGNLVDALLLAASEQAAVGEVFNIVDEPQPSMREALTIAEGPGVRIVPLPPPLLAAAAGLLERRRAATGSQTPPKLSRFVVRTASRDLVYDTSKAREVLGWQPAVALQDALGSVHGG